MIRSSIIFGCNPSESDIISVQEQGAEKLSMYIAMALAFSTPSLSLWNRETYSIPSPQGIRTHPIFRTSHVPDSIFFRCSISSKVSTCIEVSMNVEKDTKSSNIMPFHLAIPVHDIRAAREFYGGVLGLPEGRSSKSWVDFNLYGHQLVCHHVADYNAESAENAVDGDSVPVPHFGLAMSVPDFLDLAEQVKTRGIKFIIEPHIRFTGQPGEQWTMFFKDQSGNSLEFKAMTNPNNLFAKYVVGD